LFHFFTILYSEVLIPAMNPVFLDSERGYLLNIPLGERWRVGRRLMELGIPAICTGDGRLRVEVSTPLAVLQVRSVIRQHTARRQELLDGLEVCWQLNTEAGGQDEQVP
jgi:hypothetical protein